MVDVVSLGYEVETSQVLKGEQALEELTTATINADRASKGFARTTANTGAAVRSSAGAAGVLSGALGGGSNNARLFAQQLSQVAQQGAVTGNFFQALTVQAADIGLAFGTLGIAAGAAITVLGPLAQSLLFASDKADELAEALDEVETQTNEANAAYRAFILGLGSTAELTILDQITQLRREAAEIEERIAAGERQRGNSLARRLEGTREEIANLEQSLAQLRTANEERQRAEDYVRETTEAERLLGEQMQETARAAALLAVETQAARDAAMDAAREFVKLQEFRSRFAGEEAVMGQAVVVPGRGEQPPGLPGGGGRGGAGGAVDPFAGNLEQLLQSIETERETLERWYEESLVLLQDRRALELLTEEEHREALLRLDQEYYSRQAELAQGAAQAEVQARQGALNALSGLLGVFATESRAAAIAQIAINKGLAIAQAIQNTAVAQTRALAELGPIAGPPAAARIAAFGKAQIGLIAATGLAEAFRGGGGGRVSLGAGGSGGVRATRGEAAPEPQRVLVDFNGNDFIAQLFEEITTRIQKGSKTGVIYEVAR